MSSYSLSPNLFQPRRTSSNNIDTTTGYAHCLARQHPLLTSTDACLRYRNEYEQQATQIPPNDQYCMNSDYYFAQPDSRFEAYTPVLPLSGDGRHDSAIFGSAGDGSNWSMYQPSMSLSVNSPHRPLKRARTHQRTPSASTVASNGPASPYTANTLYPQIANTDYSPNSPAQAAYADQALFSKNLPTPSQTPTDASFYTYLPSQAAHTPHAQLAMKGVALDYNIPDEFIPDFYASSRHSMSSHGNNSPATPQSGLGDNQDTKQYAQQNDFRHSNPNVQLFRTESQAYQDELYNPATSYTSTPAPAPKPQPNLLTPHRNLVNERIQTANLARSCSPSSAISRERSPFRDGSMFAQSGGWQGAQPMNTAAGMRQQMKEEAAQAEFAQHRPQLNREPTKTISPKDAMLEYNGAEEPSLFQDSIPAGYKQHNGTTETWQNDFVSQPGSSFGNLVASGPNAQMHPFRHASADTNTAPTYSFMPLPPNSQPEPTPQIQNTPTYSASYAIPKMNYGDSNPEFPAQLTSMESSISEGGPPASSQESFNITSAPQRPADTRARSGAYTCTYHGCTQRFDSPNDLQKHKRDVHRPPPAKEPTPEEQIGSAHSARSSESPVPSGMTSAAIQARNSQAGPHKCTRINPSTNKPCNTIFSRPYDLTRHEDTIHNNRKQKVRCPMCREEKTFSRNDALTRHMRVVHPEVENFGGKRGRRSD